MGLHFIRNLLPASSNVTLPELKLNTTLDNCLQYCKYIGGCHPLCLDYCSAAGCPSDRRISRHKKLLISIILVTGIASFLFCCYAMYAKYFGKSTSRSPQEEQRFETHDEFVDEDHGPVVDHPIWLIRTVGLQPSVISSIAVCKYKRGDGLVEGTDCAVCLTEFDEDETLRLLPNCNHAFHIRCIDTWLGSHTSCPLCRAPVVTNTAAGGSSEEAIGNTSGEEENRTAVLDDIEESDTEIEPGDGEIGTGTEEEGGMQATRRSVSLDSLSASKISQALFNVLPMESHRNSATTRRPLRESGPNMGIVPKRLSRNQGLAKFMASSSFGRSLQVGPSSLKRSFSCSGKLFLSRYNRSRSSDLPSTIVYISLIDSLCL